MMETKRCPKCRGKMSQGFIPDFDHSGAILSHWVEGPPKKGFWGCVKARLYRGEPVAAFRCEECGYLEFYAGPFYEVQSSNRKPAP